MFTERLFQTLRGVVKEGTKPEMGEKDKGREAEVEPRSSWVCERAKEKKSEQGRVTECSKSEEKVEE